MLILITTLAILFFIQFKTYAMNVTSISINNKQKIFFSGYTKRTEGKKGQNKTNYCISESYLMRNVDSCNFAAEYVKEIFPLGTQIISEGCSQNEAYTWGILLHDANKDKKYKIIGCDIVPSVIKDAKLGVLNIYGKIICSDKDADCEKFLITDYLTNLTEKQKAIKKNFLECFEKVPYSWLNFNIKDPRYKNKVKRLVQEEQDIELTTKRLEYMNSRDIKNGIDFIPKKDIFKNIIDFKVTDIASINKDFELNSTGLVSFQNSLYHILKSRVLPSLKKYENIDAKPAEMLFQKIHKVLKNNGLFVIGNLQHDHLFDKNSFTNQFIEIEQNNQKIKVFRQSPIHKILRNIGFEPIFYSQESISKIYLPSVWKKIK